MRLYIKNMVCDRCIMVVRNQLDALQIEYKNIQLGEVELTKALSEEQVESYQKQERKATVSATMNGI